MNTEEALEAIQRVQNMQRLFDEVSTKLEMVEAAVSTYVDDSLVTKEAAFDKIFDIFYPKPPSFITTRG